MHCITSKHLGLQCAIEKDPSHPQFHPWQEFRHRTSLNAELQNFFNNDKAGKQQQSYISRRQFYSNNDTETLAPWAPKESAITDEMEFLPWTHAGIDFTENFHIGEAYGELEDTSFVDLAPPMMLDNECLEDEADVWQHDFGGGEDKMTDDFDFENWGTMYEEGHHTEHQSGDRSEEYDAFGEANGWSPEDWFKPPTGNQLTEMPSINLQTDESDGHPKRIYSDLWTADKWNSTASLHSPISNLENGREVWLGDIIQFKDNKNN
ncbi:hypothetical protein RUND412_011294 [Rhizina undulata]